jgi:hypothetical protein
MYTLFQNYYAPGTHKATHVLSKSSSSSNTPKAPTQAQINKMSAKITNVTIDHNVYENGKKGMRIHVKFDANNMLGFAGWCIAWFGDAKKNLLKYYGTSTYTNNSNNILTWGEFTPIYEYASFSDYTIFMPYEELHKEGDMSFYIELQEKTSGKSLATSAWYSFKYGSTKNVSSNKSLSNTSIIKGTVIDKNGYPIQGARVLESGTSNQVITNASGKFEIRVKEGVQLYISHQGRSIKMAARNGMFVTLK